MENEKKINKFLKHKRLIIIGLILIGLMVMIFLTYIMTYASNKPKAFKNDTIDEETTVVKKNDYFKFNCRASSMSINKDSGYIELVGEISNVTQTISSVSVKYEIHNNWTSKGSYTSDSEHKFNSGNTIPVTNTSTFPVTTKINLKVKYPINVLPLVRVKHPIVYAKVSYSRKLPDTTKGKGGTVNEVCYYTFTYSDYVNGNTVFN